MVKDITLEVDIADHNPYAMLQDKEQPIKDTTELKRDSSKINALILLCLYA